MTTFNTGNPVGSVAPRDLYDNAENLDNLVNHPTKTEFQDRLGVPRKTWHGMEQDFQQFLVNSGYTGTGAGGAYEDYDADGPLTIDALNEIFTKGGEFYRLKPDQDLPYTTTTWAADEANMVAVGDAALRQELADRDGSDNGSDMVGHRGASVRDALDSRVVSVDTIAERDALSLAAGQQVSVSSNGFSPDVGGGLFRWNGEGFERLGDSARTVAEFGATYAGDDSAAVIASLSELGYAYVPRGRICSFKNVELLSGQKLIVDGTARLPDGCSDFDRMVHAAGQSDVVIHIDEIDGNASGQSGLIGTHLIYLTNCGSPDVRVRYAHDHYYPREIANPPSPDGIRDGSSGCIFLYRCDGARVFIKRLENWGHEGVQIRESERTVSFLGMAQGSPTGDEWSGFQVSGGYNQVLSARVDYAGASGIGIDSNRSTIGQLISTNSRYFNGVNFGHTGFPASYSRVESVIVDGCDENGINFGGGTEGVVVGLASIFNAGKYGINQSDSANYNEVNGAFVSASRVANVFWFDSTFTLNNSRIGSLFPAVLNLSAISGNFEKGEVITGGSSGATANVSYFWNSTKKYVQISGVSGTFQSSETVTGGASGATATVDSLTTPARVLKSGTTVERFSDVILDDSAPTGIAFVSIAGLTSVNVSNANVRASKLPVIIPSNGSGAQAQLYISSIQDGQFTVNTGTGSAAGSGAGFRYTLN